MRTQQPAQQPQQNRKAGGYIPSGRKHQIFRDGNKSLRGQWQEGGNNVDTTRIQMAQIEELRENLAKSYDCDVKHITFKFAPIMDKEDPDKDTCLDLQYTLEYFDPDAGNYARRTIYTAKIIVPEQLKRRAEDIKRDRETAARLTAGPPVRQSTARHMGGPR